MSLALGLLGVSTNAISPLELVNPAMAAKKQITTDDIADNAVTSPKIKDGEVKTSDIEDGTIAGNDVSPSFMIRKTLKDDTAGHAQGWDPNFLALSFFIKDSDVIAEPDSTSKVFVDVKLQTQGGAGIHNCSAGDIITDPAIPGFYMACDHAPPEVSSLEYIITKLPAHVVTSSASATETSSSTSSSTPIISSPFSSLGGH